MIRNSRYQPYTFPINTLGSFVVVASASIYYNTNLESRFCVLSTERRCTRIDSRCTSAGPALIASMTMLCNAMTTPKYYIDKSVERRECVTTD